MSRRPLFDKKEENQLKRIDRIETIIGRLMRRSNKTAKAMITPYPISSCFTGEIGGPMLKYMFSARGIISKGQIHFNVKPKESVKVLITLENDLGSNERSYKISTKSMMVEPNMEVYSGDRLIISAELTDPEKECDKAGQILLNEVWCSFLWIPNVKEVDVKRFLIEDLENGISEEVN